LIVFSLATLRTILPLAKEETFTVANLIFAITHVVALWYLFGLLVTLK
jgi:hypothetical protein